MREGRAADDAERLLAGLPFDEWLEGSRSCLAR
jgi:hypothetical protein